MAHIIPALMFLFVAWVLFVSRAHLLHLSAIDYSLPTNLAVKASLLCGVAFLIFLHPAMALNFFFLAAVTFIVATMLTAWIYAAIPESERHDRTAE